LPWNLHISVLNHIKFTNSIHLLELWVRDAQQNFFLPYQLQSRLFHRRQIRWERCLQPEWSRQRREAEHYVANHFSPLFVHRNNKILADTLNMTTAIKPRKNKFNCQLAVYLKIINRHQMLWTCSRDVPFFTGCHTSHTM
jgi:hypothetical protein